MLKKQKINRLLINNTVYSLKWLFIHCPRLDSLESWFKILYIFIILYSWETLGLGLYHLLLDYYH